MIFIKQTKLTAFCSRKGKSDSSVNLIEDDFPHLSSAEGYRHLGLSAELFTGEKGS